MITDDFAYFKYDSTYNEFLRNPGLGISDKTIVFVEDTNSIYARGHQFGGKHEYQGTNGVTIEGNTISLDTSYIEDLIPERIVYTAGNYINISNTNKISVDLESLKDALDDEIRDIPVASATTLGGIKVGYNDGVTSNIAGRNYKVQLDSNNNAFVYVPWTDTKPTTPETPTETGVTKDYVDDKVASLTDRLNNIVSEINWDELFDEYGVKPNAGQEVDPEESTITQWVHDPDNIALVWQQLTASNAKPSWVSVVATKYDEWITGTQIQQLENQISLIAGNFDSNGDPIEGKWSGIILTAKDEHGKSVIDLAADQVIASGEIVTPVLISTAINAEDITITSKLTATNIEVQGGTINIKDKFYVGQDGYGKLNNQLMWTSSGIFIDTPANNTVSFTSGDALLVRKTDYANDENSESVKINPGSFTLETNVNATQPNLNITGGLYIKRRDGYLSIKVSPFLSQAINDYANILPSPALAEKGELCVGDQVSLNGVRVRPLYIKTE